jgi:hypothetical protein
LVIGALVYDAGHRRLGGTLLALGAPLVALPVAPALPQGRRPEIEERAWGHPADVPGFDAPRDSGDLLEPRRQAERGG